MVDNAQQSDNKPKKRVAVIGAGCVGLTAIKECLDESDRIDVVCFEQEPHTGGQWRYVEVTKERPNPYSSIYKSTIINTSKAMMTFSDYAIPGSWPTYLHNKKVVRYFDMYVHHFRLKEHIRFGTKVVEIRELHDEQNRWMVRFHPVVSWTSAQSPASVTIQEEIFDHVMMCTGHHSVPRYPSFPGMKPDEPDAFTGRQIHSHFYRDAGEFKEKNVVIVGLGNSAVDVAVELSMNQSQVYLSRRNPIWVAPRWLLGKPLDQYTTRFTFWLPLIVFKFISAFLLHLTLPKLHPLMKPNCMMFENHTTINSILHERISTGTIIPQVNIKRIGPGKRVEFEDGTVIDDIDAIIWCTGYHVNYPILDPTIIADGREGLENNRVWLWKYMLPPRHPNLAFIGLFQAVGALMPIAELQCRFLIQTWAGRSSSSSSIPDATRMDKDIQEVQQKIRKQYYDAPRHTIQVDYAPYGDWLAKQIGCFPSFWRLVRHFGVVRGIDLWMETTFGPPIPMHYRLVGPHAWEGDRKKKDDGQSRDGTGEAARQVIWGYKGCKGYTDSKYLRDDGLLLPKDGYQNGVREGMLVEV
ncbi:Cyclopentanone 1,2-monooxygenase (CPMO) [Entomortierella chlamydospora]|uniref:Flavin-containing monooxygenase 1 n=1 Tax=Entomortierella chlamydospora TaxID=101097 RepID=A0A9P6N2R9_9FUNG|nr:Cyclopentanone 1,2-monooxygenase (CPMO) [Entomortierella chlamydospora]